MDNLASLFTNEKQGKRTENIGRQTIGFEATTKEKNDGDEWQKPLLFFFSQNHVQMRLFVPNVICKQSESEGERERELEIININFT